MKGPVTLVAENRFLQSFCAVAASSVLVSGTLFLLTSTAPWTPPEIVLEPATPDAARYASQAADAVLASDQAELGPGLDDADRTTTAATDKAPDEARTIEPTASEGLETIAALGAPLDAETAEAGGEVDGDLAASSSPQEASDNPAEGGAPLEVAAITAAEAPGPTAGERSETATMQFAQVMTTLPPRVITSERSEAATDQIAEVLAALPPAPPPPLNVKAALTSDTPAGPSASDKIEVSGLKVAALTAATPAGAPLVEVAAVVTPPPPLPRRKPEAPPAPKIAAQPAPETPPAPKVVAQPAPETPPEPKATVAATPPRERPAVQPAPPQQTARPGGLFGNWKPMALAPADEPAPAASRPATARPSSGAYASQVWARLARHKPRAGQRGSASVAFAIAASGSLGAVRIARSSGNPRIDQLALATVRNAAPFPPPPSGVVSYTIRIDF